MRSLALVCLTLALGGCFPRNPGPRLAHFADQAPAVGAPAPEFELPSVDGEVVRLSDLIGERPLVVQFGSHSCPVYRYRRHSMGELIDEYGDRAHFVVVYTLEAHPAGSKSPYDDEEWLTMINRVTGVRVTQPGDDRERLAQAAFSRDRLGLAQTMLVDRVDDGVWTAYGGASSPGFVIDVEGRIASRQVWIDPKEIRRTLDHLLAPTSGEPSSELTLDN